MSKRTFEQLLSADLLLADCTRKKTIKCFFILNECKVHDLSILFSLKSFENIYFVPHLRCPRKCFDGVFLCIFVHDINSYRKDL